jgi:hypothetical protein
MKELKEELKTLLAKYNANIFVAQDEDDSFIRLQLQIGEESEDIDTGYRDLIISKYNL